MEGAMPETMTIVSQPTELTVANPSGGDGLPPKPDISLDPKDFASEMAKLQAEAETKSAPVAPVETTGQPTSQEPTQPKSAVATPEVKVPDKFKTPDGKLDTEKLTKSFANADEMLKKYSEMEKELKRKQNAYGKVTLPAQVPQVQTQETQTTPDDSNMPFNQLVVRDLVSKGMDITLARQLAPVLVSLTIAGKETAKNEAMSDIAEIRESLESQKVEKQLRSIAEKHPWVFTPEGMQKLSEIRQAKPWLNQAPEPWKEALSVYLGNQDINSESQVSTLNPTTQPARAPVPQGSVVIPANSTPAIDLSNQAAVDAHLKTLTPEQQKEFFKKLGLPWI